MHQMSMTCCHLEGSCRVEKCTNRSIMKFNEEKSQVLAPIQVGSDHLESSFIEKDLGTLVAPSWMWASNVSLKPAASCFALGKRCQQSERSHPFTSLSMGETQQECWIQAWAPSTKEFLRYWSNSREGPQRWRRHRSICHTRRGWESWDCLTQEREGLVELISGRGGEEDGARLFSAASRKRTGAMGTNWNTRNFT